MRLGKVRRKDRATAASAASDNLDWKNVFVFFWLWFGRFEGYGVTAWAEIASGRLFVCRHRQSEAQRVLGRRSASRAATGKLSGLAC